MDGGALALGWGLTAGLSDRVLVSRKSLGITGVSAPSPSSPSTSPSPVRSFINETLRVSGGH